MEATLASVNVGRPRGFESKGKKDESAIWKQPVDGRVAVRGVNIDGDDQADRAVHGGADKAVYAYAIEDVRFWESELGRPIELSAVGENLTTEQLDVSSAVIGSRWEIGTAMLEVSEPRAPCYKLAHKMGDPTFIRRFTKAGRPGAYLRIVREGEIGAGDTIRISAEPEHGVSIGDVFRIFSRDRHEAGSLVELPGLSASWREWATRQAS